MNPFLVPSPDAWRDGYDLWKLASPYPGEDEPEWNEFDDDGWEGWEIER